MDLRKTQLKEDAILQAFYQKVIESVSLEENYLILIGCDSYDVPFKSKDDTAQKDASDEMYSFILCAICPVKQTKATLHYIPEEKVFHDGGITNIVSAPELGFLFPAFDNRATNIYNALYYSRSSKNNHPAFVERIFNTPIPKPAAEQKQSFEALLSNALAEECSFDVVQSVHDELRQRIDIHKESRVPDPLLVSKEDVKTVLSDCGVSDTRISKFSVDYDETFGFEAELHPKNIIDDKRTEIHMPDVVIKVSRDRSDLIETRVIGGVKYIMINADEDIEVNGVSIHIHDKDTATVF